MQKTWNMTLYRDGRPVGERRGLSESDAATQIYRLTSSAPVELIEESAASETGELQLAA
ncbi:MAG TPA: hypothetical protein VMH33_13490 [Solirubrobacterales bacterium]|nr:hypothetical protein [Solirubrobacterales bacterium]